MPNVAAFMVLSYSPSVKSEHLEINEGKIKLDHGLQIVVEPLIDFTQRENASPPMQNHRGEPACNSSGPPAW